VGERSRPRIVIAFLLGDLSPSLVFLFHSRYRSEEMMMEQLPKTYDPKTIEEVVAKRWERQGYGNPDNLPEDKNSGRFTKPFVVMMAPPNITGTLHMGHALEATIVDTIVRFKRMEGYRTLYLPGTDHAGIATQNVVEKALRKEGKTRFDLGREKFIERVWEWQREYGRKILDQFKRLGVSVDWSRERFTMDPLYVKAVETAFRHYEEKGWIYQGERVINWCTRCASSLSDLELEYREEKGTLWRIRYPLEGRDEGGGYVVVATTRPETMLGDTAVAVHPNDERYEHLVGKRLHLPLTDRTIPLIADEAVDRSFGTGAVKVTPAHDLTDAEIGERHKLERIAVIDKEGKMSDAAPKPYRNLSVHEAREAILRDLEAAGLLEGGDPYTHNVAVCYRCETPVEPLPSKQWFLKMSELAKLASDAYRQGRIRIVPERWRDIALERLARERDWCISRQIWWGHRIPVPGEEDVLDTWFSSALWPFATLGWPDACEASRGPCIPKPGSDLDRFYPTQWMTSARDILFLWINRMVFSALELTNDIPFTEVYIHPTVLTKEGRRMSKSLGTGIDPLTIIERYGADALRFGLLWQLTGTQDIRFDESAIIAGKKFLNKLWNAARYTAGKTEGHRVPEHRPEPANEEDRTILEELERAIANVERELAELRFGQALERFYDFFWHALCDRYLEATKHRNDDDAKRLLLWIISVSLRVLHPMIPFITDELWEKLPHEKYVPLMIAEWPKINE
jgi:valyl-tRNA synthetase